MSIDRIGRDRRSHQKFRRSLQLATLEPHLSDDEIEDICRDLGHAWRNRKLPPGVTIRSMVYRHLNPDRSIAAVLADLASLADLQADAPTDAAWCQARSRVPEAALTELIHRRARCCRRRFGDKHRWGGRSVFIVDGSTVSMPDEPALLETFGYANTRHGLSRFPVARITFIELAGVESIWDYRLGPYRQAENAQFHDMWHTLPGGCICLCDRLFCTFYNLAKLRNRRIGVLTRLHQRRDPWQLIRQGRSLGRNQWIVPFRLAPSLRRKYDDPTLPQVLWVRLIRVTFRRGRKKHTIWLVTTLMDPQKYPRKVAVKFYRRRWGIEPRIGSIKTTLQADVLRSKSPGAIRREVAATILGHNLVWLLMHEAAEAANVSAADISFAGAVKTILAFSQALRWATDDRPETHRQMLRHIARQTNHHPFDRVEPRLVKRDPRRYGFLKIPRRQARLQCLS